MSKIRILIADDHPLVADSLSLLMGSVSTVEVVGIVRNGVQVLDFLEKYEADVVLVDYHMPVMNGVELLARLREKYPRVKTIMLTMNEEATFIKESIQAGVDGFVMKSAEKAELIKAIQVVASGKKFFGEKVVRKLAEVPDNNSATGRTRVQDIQSLTKREIEIIRLIAEDLESIAIAARLNISPATVDTHRRNLMKKIGVSSAVGLVRWGLKNGVVDEI